MLFVQYNTVQNPSERDTKNIWDIRNELAEEQKKHSRLLSSIQETKEKIYQFSDANDATPEEILHETYKDLQMQSGFLPVNGPGFKMTIKPSVEAVQFGYELEPVQPLLLTRLVNELNRNGAKYIEIGGQRVTFQTAIRDINGRTTVNGRPLGKTDIEIFVISATVEQAQKMYNYVLASSLPDEFYIDNYLLEVEEVEQNISIASTIDAIN